MKLLTINRLILKKAVNLKIPAYHNFYARVHNRNYKVVSQPNKVLAQNEFEKYNSCFQDIVDYLTNLDKVIYPEVNQYFKEILNYNVLGHDQATGPLVVGTYMHFAPPEKQTHENMYLAYIMGWVSDMIANSFQIVDDILDESVTRANKRCWYKHDQVGLKAINHASAIADGAFMLLNNFLSKHPNYIPILQLTHEVKFKTSLSQTFDTLSEKRFNFFTKQMYKTASIHRGSYLALTHPVCIGMYLADVCDQKLHSEVRAVFIELGLYLAAQNDILDCYGKPEVTGKYGTDILVGKCTWLAAETMADANPSQRELFKRHYGKSDLKSQQEIQNLYEELEILKKFLIFEKESYRNIRVMVENMSHSISKTLMYQIIDSIYRKN